MFLRIRRVARQPPGSTSHAGLRSAVMSVAGGTITRGFLFADLRGYTDFVEQGGRSAWTLRRRRSGRLGSREAAGLRPAPVAVSDWNTHVEREVARYEDGEARLPGLTEADDRQRQLTRMGNAAGGAGLALLMDGRRDEAGTWFARAAERYRESFAEAPPGSWGRPIGAVKARLLAGDWDGARADAEWALDVDSRNAESPIGRYAASPGAARARPRRRGAGASGVDPGPRRLPGRRRGRAGGACLARCRRLRRRRAARCSARSRRARSTSRTFLSPTP